MTAAPSGSSRFTPTPVSPAPASPAPADPATRPEPTGHGVTTPDRVAARDGAPTQERRGANRPWSSSPRAQASPVERTAVSDADGYVVVAVGATRIAVAVSQVREIIRAVRLELLPDQRADYGHGVALVDARGRSIPVVDLRTDTTRRGDVLLPLYRHHLGLVVDQVVAVRTPVELVVEDDHLPDALPSYARAVLRPPAGGDPVLLVELPDAAELARDAVRPDDRRLGADVLTALESA